jgi:hypothetical protein
MTIDEVYKFINFIVKKSNAGGYVTPSEFNLLINRAQIQYFNKLYGNQNDYRYDRPVPKISYAVTEKISNSLSPFLSDKTTVTIDANGQCTTPTDMIQMVAVTKEVSGKEYEITRVEQDRVANNLSSYYDAPDTEFPIYAQLRTKLQFYPKTLASASVIYLKKPTNMVWAFTTVSGRYVYDPLLSVQPLWSDVDMNEVMYIALSYIGVNLKDQEVSQFANIKTQTGL